MELFNSAKLEMIYQIYGEETQVKQNFSDVAKDAAPEDLVAFSKLVASLAEEDYELNYMYHTVTNQLVPDAD